MNKSMIQIVAELTAKGHNIKYSIRKDGGILIRSIDGEHFTGAHGNARARTMVGAELSEARSTQLKYATQVRVHPVKIEVKEEIKEAYLRVKKIWNKAFRAKGGKPHPAGYFGWKRIKTSIKEWGEEEAMRRILEAEKYATGIAYSKNVKHLVDYIRMTAKQVESNELKQLAEDLADSAYTIRDEWILPAYEALYALNNGRDPKEVAQKVRRILRL